MNLRVLWIFLSFLVLTTAPIASAKLFRNAYLSFELPPRWECVLEGTEWVCRSTVEKDAPEAIIVLTAKEVGPTDSLEQYEAHLKTARSVPGQGGAPTSSQVKNVSQRQLSGHVWIDALHLGSEVPAYFTRYLATVKQKVAVLVTFSAHQKYYTKYSTDFLNAIQSLNVIASAELFKDKVIQGGGGAGEVYGPGVGTAPGAVEPEAYPEESKAQGSSKQKLFILGVVVAAVGLFLILRRKRKR